MANTIIELRRSNVSGNVPSSLANGEIAINTYDGKLFYRGGVSNTIQTIERFQGPAGLNQEVQFNDSGVLGSDSGLTYNKTTDVLTVVGGAIVGGVNVTPQIQFAFTQANAAFTAANSAGVYANGAFAKANTQDTINLTQNNSITAAFAAANAATATDTTQNNSITAAFTRANNSLNSNTGGTVTANTTFSGNVFLTGNGTTLSVTSNISFISPNTQNTIIARMINGGTLSFSSNSGELFSITDSLATGSIFSVNDISGLPVIDVNANGEISFAQYGGNVHVYNTATSVSNTTGALVVDGGVGVKGNVYADAVYDGGIEVITFANGAFNTANAAFLAANAATATDTTQNNSITAAFTAANSAGVYANGAFAKANTQDTINLTQNNSITAAFAAANAATAIDTTQNNSIAAAFAAANAATATDTTQNNSITAAFTAANSSGVYANSAFTRANNSLNANTGGSITGDISITGNLTVTGNTTYTNTITVLIGDNIIVLNADLSPSAQPTENAGIEIDRGAQPNSSFLWIETSGKWAANNGNTEIFLASEATLTSAFNTANAAFLAANAATATDTTQNNSITAAFAAANAATATDLTQNNSITAAFAAANAATATDLTQNNSIAAAFTRANNSLNANTGGIITGDLTIGTGAGGIIAGANVIYSNVFVANSNGYIQFSDGSRQFTANAGSGGGTTDTFARNQANSAFIQANAAFNVANTGGAAANSFGQIVANVGTILATSSNDSFQIIGESGISVSSNVSAKKVIVSVPAGFTFTTADYGFVTDTTNVIYDYGTI
jgi:hypothetical protein